VLLVSWLLLFTIVTDSVEARGTEIALAKLRGHGRAGILIMGLAEPVAVLLAAWPVGVLAGFAAAGQLGRIMLVPGTPASLPLTAWAAAAVSVGGGLTAVAMAAHRGLRRGVVEQFRRPAVQAAGRGWIADSILITASLAGLIQVLSLQRTEAGPQGALILLVPGLLGLAVAVAASRLLPVGCRSLYGLASRCRALAAYLALRHIARRSGGVRTTIVLATTFSMAAFAFAAWSVGQRNDRLVAQTQVGAADVLTVEVPAGQNLGAIVAKADPSGRLATAVDAYDGTLAVDPARFARIAYWPAHSAPPSTAELAPPAPPIVLSGDALRVTLDIGSMSVLHGRLYANMTTAASPVALGGLPAHGQAAFTGSLTGCPCVLRSLALKFPVRQRASGRPAPQVRGQLTVVAMATRLHGRWIPAVPSRVLRTAANWRDVTPRPLVPSLVAAGPRGLTWTIRSLGSDTDPTLAAESYPVPMPGIVAAASEVPVGWEFAGNGLDGNVISIRVKRVSPWLPSAPADGLIIDRRYAELAAAGNLTLPILQVWLAAGALPRIRPKLIAAHVTIVSVDSASAAMATIGRQGPALASALFLADAAAAALLATGAAILGLYASARRRRYEYAALEASGVGRRTLRRALQIELAVVLGFGTLAGAATGLIAAAFVLKSVPEFAVTPDQPVLSYVPPVGPCSAALGAAALLLILAACAASLTLIQGVRADLLREAAE
jgi:putative ABC transport system permease protein